MVLCVTVLRVASRALGTLQKYFVSGGTPEALKLVFK